MPHFKGGKGPVIIGEGRDGTDKMLELQFRVIGQVLCGRGAGSARAKRGSLIESGVVSNSALKGDTLMPAREDEFFPHPILEHSRRIKPAFKRARPLPSLLSFPQLTWRHNPSGVLYLHRRRQCILPSFSLLSKANFCRPNIIGAASREFVFKVWANLIFIIDSSTICLDKMSIHCGQNIVKGTEFRRK